MAGDFSACTFQDTPFLGGTCGPLFALFMGYLENILRNQWDIADPCHRLGKDGTRLSGDLEVDFVVVGAGVAGPVVASRLSENPDWKVLLIEAGPEEPTVTEVPAFSMSATNTNLDWNFTTVPQKDACLNSGGVCKWPRGKMVSGTGSMHGMMYTRGHRSIYDRWEAMGNRGWSYKDVLPYFKLAENNKDIEDIEEHYHGFRGPLVVQRYPYHPPLAEDILLAFNELGYRRVDHCGLNQTGVNIAQMMVHEGLRASTPRMYLRPHSDRRNLHVAINSHVTKILIDPWKRKAGGVEILTQDGRRRKVVSKHEVILSGGAIGSPQLLLLSGIGPRKHLTKRGIPVIKDLPVGRNLMNHVAVKVNFYINEPSYDILTLKNFKQFLQSRDGPLASTGITQTTAFIKSKYATGDAPDLQIFFNGMVANCPGSGLPQECSDEEMSKCGRRRIEVRPTLILPRSVGYLKLRSTDPLDKPIINPRYFSDRRDIDVLLDGVRAVLNFSQTETMRRWGMELIADPVTGCESPEFGSDEYWVCVIRQQTEPENHQGSSCRMGPASDPRAVVDPQFRVHGLRNLRVVDASVFPYVPNGNPVSPIVMMAERCSDMIKNHWEYVH